jgi:serine/threonine-protein kinase
MAERRAAREKAQTAASAAAAGPPVDPADIDQASGLYLKQKGLVRPELIREADRMQREFAAYGLSQPLLTVFRQIDAVSWQTAKQLEQIDIASVVRSEAWKQQAVPGYVITGKIAAGGFATVFAAKPLFAEGRLALKILRANATPSALVQFRHEAELLSQFEHPNIVKVRDYGALPSNLHYMAMDFIDGSAVDFLLSKKGPFAPEVVLQITRQTAEALQYLQREGYIHRDVKPENILIDRKGNAHLCDFGFAQLIQETAPAGVGDTTVGTAAYMSPEQARGELDIKVGTDIYALGLTCYAMMTGKPPFQGENTGQIMAERFAGGVAAPDLAPLAACPPLQSVIGRMLDPERVKRYRNYEELLEALEAVRL